MYPSKWTKWKVSNCLVKCQRTILETIETESFQRVSSTGCGGQYTVAIPAVLHAMGHVGSDSVCTAFWGCAGGKWLSLPPELHRAASYLIRGAPVRKPCRMKPHLHIYLPSFKTTEGTTKKLETAAATPSPCSRFHLRRRPRSHHQSSLRHREWQCLLRAVINRLFWFLPPSLPL